MQGSPLLNSRLKLISGRPYRPQYQYKITQTSPSQSISFQYLIFITGYFDPKTLFVLSYFLFLWTTHHLQKNMTILMNSEYFRQNLLLLTEFTTCLVQPWSELIPVKILSTVFWIEDARREGWGALLSVRK